MDLTLILALMLPHLPWRLSGVDFLNLNLSDSPFLKGKGGVETQIIPEYPFLRWDGRSIVPN
jgi:hypothetical protein